jgi:multicomponent Na+:H+ antiporter subunit D
MSHDVLVALPLIIPLATGVLAMLFYNSRDTQRLISVIGAAALLMSGIALLMAARQDGILVSEFGGWEPPFGINMVADLFSSLMVMMTGLIAFTVSLYSLATMDPRRESFGFYPLFHILLMGITGSFLTGDMFNLFVWFEVMLIASFVLIALGGERPQLEGAIKYVALNLISSAILLGAIGLLYGLAGTLNMADLGMKLQDVDEPWLVTTVGMLFLVSFGIKAAIFPMFFWLPASYHTPPIAVTALVAALLSKVGVYALIRAFTLIFTQETSYTHQILLVVAGATMVTGVLGAVAQYEVRKLLSFHIISQIGYMLVGLAIMSPLALAGSIFYIIHNMVTKTNLFLISGVTYRLQGTYELKKLGSIYRYHPYVSTLFFVSAMALAGMPPFSGFFAKLTLVRGSLEIEHYVIVAVALFTSVLTLFSMTKIWTEGYWTPSAEEENDELPPGVNDWPGWNRTMISMFLPIIILAILSVGMGILAQPVISLLVETAEQLLDPSIYIEAVIGDQP